MGDEQADRIERLHDAATDIVGAETEPEVYRLTVEAAERVLAFDFSYVCSVEGDRFVPAATRPPELADRLRSIPIDHGVTAVTHREGRSFLITDIAAHDLAEPVHGFEGSALSVPIGEFAVFQTVTDAPGAFTETDLELAELLAVYARETVSRIRTKAELERQNERLDEFVGVVSHDLRGPLSIAEGRLELARETGALDHLDEVKRAHERMRELIEDLLSLARHGRVVGDPDPVPLGAVAREAWADVTTDGATLSVENDADATVPADRSRLRELLSNLFRNCVEHGGPAPHVRVEPLPEGGFAVADDGPGFPADAGTELFEVGVTEAADGTGFGLAIVERIADAHGWTVHATESDAGGARFEFRP